jgi:hypothetical protein
MSRKLRVNEYLKEHPEWTAGSIRWLIFQAKPRVLADGTSCSNGLEECGAISRVGRRVFIDEENFDSWMSRGGR